MIDILFGVTLTSLLIAIVALLAISWAVGNPAWKTPGILHAIGGLVTVLCLLALVVLVLNPLTPVADDAIGWPWYFFGFGVLFVGCGLAGWQLLGAFQRFCATSRAGRLITRTAFFRAITLVWTGPFAVVIILVWL